MNTSTAIRRVVLLYTILLISFSANGQQLLDDFNRNSSGSATVGQPTIGGANWTEVENGTTTSTGCNLTSNYLRLSTNSSNGREYVWRDCSGNYNTTLGTNTTMLTWQFKWRETLQSPTGFNSGGYGIAVVLGSNSSNFLTADGYAVVFGESSSTDRIRLVRFAGGLSSDANITNLITYGDLEDDYMAIIVTYTPSTNLWQMYTDDDEDGFSDVSYASANLRGTATDNTYTNQDLKYVGALWNHGTSTSENGRVDEIYIPILPAYYYSKSTGDLNLTSSWGTNLDGSGTQPPNFTNAAQYFNIRNNLNPTISNTWTVSGTGSRVTLGDSTSDITFTVPPTFAFTGTIDISAHSKLVLQNATVPTIGLIDFPSVVEYASASTQTIRAAAYWDLICSSTGGRTWSSGTTSVMDTFVVGANAFNNGNGTFDFAGPQTMFVPAIKYESITNTGGGDRILSPTGTIVIGGQMTPSIGLYTVTGSTVDYDDDNNHTVPVLYVASGPNYNNLIISGNDDYVLEGPMTIGGDLSILDGQFWQNTGTTIFPLTVNGNLIINGGDYYFSDGTGANVLTLKGNLTQISGRTRISGSVLGRITFAGNTVQTISASDSTRFESVIFTVASGAYVKLQQNLALHRNTTTSLRGTMNVNSGGTLDCGNFRISSGIGSSGNVVFNLNNGATLVTASPSGVVGSALSSITTSNIVSTYNSGASYKFNANVPQVTSLSNNTMRNLTIDNTANVTISASLNVTDNINFINGRFITGANKITLQSAGTVTGAGAGKYVFGTLEKYISLGTTSKNFEIGDANNYLPADLTFPPAANGAGSILAKINSGDHPNLPGSGINPAKSVNKYWTLTNNGVAGILPMTGGFSFNPSDYDLGANPLNFVVRNYNSSTWFVTSPNSSTATRTQGDIINDFGDFELGEPFPPPTVTCPATVNTNALVGCSAVVNFGVTITGNPTPSLSYSQNPGTLFPVGTTNVTATVVNINGSASCSFDVVVLDVTPPVLQNCPTDITAFAAPGVCDTIVSWTPPTATDNCSAIVTGDHAPGSVFHVGTTTVTYTATDPSNNTATCSFNVIVIDNQFPQISNCPADTTVYTNGSCGLNVSWTEPTATDNCTFTFTPNYAPLSFFPTGITQVVYTATDSSGNASICSFFVTVLDTQPPVITCPADITDSNDPGVCGKTVTFAATAVDNCSLTYSYTPASGSLFAVGTTQVMAIATDSSGNADTCYFNVTINDTEPPQFSGCPSNINVNTSGSCGQIVNWTPPTASDNCQIASSGNDRNPGDFFSVGTTTVTYTATDDAGNTNTCSFTVTVTDNEFPVISNCPTDITIVLSSSVSCTSNVTWTPPTPSDNCTIGSFTSNYQPGDLFTAGTTVVTYTLTDSTGNSVQCSFNVTVTGASSDFSASACDTLYLPWGDTATSTGDYLHTYVLPNGCDSIVTAHVSIITSPSSSFSATACDSYQLPWGPIVTTTGDYVNHYNVGGNCDSIVTAHITINYSYATSASVSGCDSYDLPWGGTVTVSDDYVHTYVVNGCDSVVTLHVTINLSTSSSYIQTTCDSLTLPWGTFVTVSDDYVHTYQTVFGCDSVVTAHITIIYSTSSSFSQTACDSTLLPWGTMAYSTGAYTHVYPAANGCDSLVTANILILTSPTTQFTDSACEVYTLPWGGNVTVTGDFTHAYPAANGCDSVVTAHIFIYHNETSSYSAVSCDSYVLPWGGVVTVSDDYLHTYTSIHGCDSVVTAHVTINDSTSSSYNATACDSYTFPWGGSTTVSGDFNHMYSTVAGCDSNVTAHVIVNYSTQHFYNETSCDSLVLPWGLVVYNTGNYGHLYQTVNGCDSLVTAIVTIGYSSSTGYNVSSCDSLVLPWGDTVYTSNDYPHTYLNELGCDSIVTAHVTINHSTTFSYSIDACDSITLPWGQQILSSGEYNHTYFTINGCDSVVTALVSVNYSTSSSYSVTACDSYSLPWGGVMTVSGDTTHTYQTIHNCDSVVTAHVTINYSDASSYSAVACDTYTLPWGPAVTVSDDYTHTYQTVLGCDSVVTAHVTINYSSTATVNITICADSSYTPPGGAAQTASGTYVTVIQNASGCDSTITTNLTVLNPIVVTAIPGTITCNGGLTSVTVSATGGTGNYVSGTGVISNQSGGLNTYTVVDDLGCSGSVSITIAEPAALIMSPCSHVDAPCFGAGGSVSAGVVSNGVGTVIYTWRNSSNIIVGNTPAISGLQAGTYTLTVTDNCSSVTCSETITQPLALNMTACSHIDATCNSGTGSVSAGTVTNAVGTVNYVWTNSSNVVVGNTPTVNNLGAGTYTLTVSDNCSTLTCSQTVIVPSALSMSACSHVDATCFGTSTGSVAAGTVSNAIGAPVYTWTNSSNVIVGITPTVSNLPAGTYTLTVTDNCTSVTCSQVINEPAALSMAACTHTDAVCFGAGGSVSAGVVSNAVGATVYAWRNSSNLIVGNTSTVSGLPAGTYTLTVSDNCSSVTCSETISQPAALTMGACSHTDALCNGASTGSVTAGIVSNAVGIAAYSWTNSSNVVVGTTATVNNLPAGTYTLIVTDNCSSVTCTETILEPLAMTMAACSHTDAACNGASTGSVSAGVVSNPVGIVSYSWTNSSNVVVGTTATVNNLPAGTYTLTVTDNCSSLTCTQTIGQPPALSMTACSHTDALCNGASTGSVTAGIVSNAVGIASYSWTNSSNVVVGTTATVNNLPAGTYTLTVTDNCSSVTCSETIAQPSALSMTACSHIDASCNGGGGSVSAGTVNNAVGTVFYMWRNSSNLAIANTPTVTGLPAGTYTLTVSDNCSSVTCSETITQPSALSMSSCSHVDVTCNGASTGSVTAGTVSNAVGVVNYSWTNSSNVVVGTSPTVNNLPAGTYSLTVSDDCRSVTCSVTILEPLAMSMTACSHIDAACNGASTGSVTAGIVSNAVGVPTYSWTNSSNIIVGTTSTVNNLPAGTYTLTVTDNCGTLTCTQTISEPNAMSMTACSHVDETCFGASAGSVTAGVVSNAVGTAVYAWRNSSNILVGNTASVNGLPAGTYTLTVTDNCSSVTCSETIQQPPQLSMTSCSHTDALCNGASTGSVSAGTVTNALGVASYSWTNSSNVVVGTTATVNNLPAGTYTLTVTDNCGSITCSQTIGQPSALSMSACSHTNVICNGASTGSVTAGTVSNAVGSPSYSWTNSSNVVVGTTPTVSNLPAGTYTLSVSDNCSSVSCIQIVTEPAPLSLAACSHTNAGCNGAATGSVTAGAVTNAVGTANYVWTNSSNVVVGTTATVNNLVAGTYTLTVTDNCGSVTCTQTITEPAAINMTACSHLDAQCFGGTGSLLAGTVTGTQGVVLYAWRNSSNVVIANTALVSGVVADTYTLTVTDNCSSTTCTETIAQPPALSMTACSHTDVVCNGASTGSVTAGTVSNAIGTVTYSWRNSSNVVVGTSATVNNLPAGTYTLTVTDNCGSTTCSQTIAEPAGMSMAACSHSNPLCSGSSTGSVTAGIVSNANGIASYTWRNSGNVIVGTTATVNNLAAGTYTLTVTDNCGSITCSQTIVDPAPVSVTITVGATGCSSNNGTATANPIGGTGSFTYLWSPGNQTTQSITGLGVGNYSVRVTDGNGCTSSTSAVVTVSGGAPSVPGTIGGPLGACRGQNGVVFSVSPVAGALTYIWTLPAGATGSSTSSSITVNFGNTFSTGNICVRAVNNCGQSSNMCRSITRITSAPNTPGAITGPLSLCPNNSAGYSVVQVNNATAYIWTTTGGLSVTGGAGTNAVTIQAPAGFITGTISVRSSNCIGQSGMRTITVKGVPSTPIWKTTPPTVTCGGGCYVFNIDNVQDAVSWTYTAPAGCVITSTGAPGSGNPLTTTKSKATICFPAGFVSGTVSIRSNNACGQSAAITWAVSSIPAQPGAITGAGTVCRSQSNVQYSIVAVPTATSYAWTITGNAQITNGQGTNSIRVRFVNSNANNVTLSVRAVNACGQSPVRTRSINVNQNCRVTEEAGEITQSASTDILMNAYPNPTTGKVMITFNSEENIRYKLNVTDLMGKVVISDEIISIQDQNMYEINLENEAKGLYILSLRREDGDVMSLKLILK